jgi:hypothetical protein
MFFQNRTRQFYDMVTGFIRRGIEAGGFRETDPLVAARAYVGMISYHGLVNVLFRDPVVRIERALLVEEMVELFLEGLRSRR